MFPKVEEIRLTGTGLQTLYEETGGQIPVTGL